MLIDHIGFLFFPDNLYFRFIGRLSFPIFAFLIANGYFHTGNVKKYLFRLFLFFLICQIPYTFFFGGIQLNIFFTLFLGLSLIYLFDSLKQKFGLKISWLIFSWVLVGVFVFNLFVKFDYDFYGILTIFFFYLFYHSKFKTFLAELVLNLVYLFLAAYLYLANNDYLAEILNINFVSVFQILSLGALVFIFLYNQKPGYRFKYLFYIFYPGHLIVLYLIKMLFW
jgi:hypothetical protein